MLMGVTLVSAREIATPIVIAVVETTYLSYGAFNVAMIRVMVMTKMSQDAKAEVMRGRPFGTIALITPPP
jgi:hypothetical protein